MIKISVAFGNNILCKIHIMFFFIKYAMFLYGHYFNHSKSTLSLREIKSCDFERGLKHDLS
jgi:hypothetical protein